MKSNFQGGTSIPASRGEHFQKTARGDARPTRFFLLFLAAIILFVAFGAAAETTNVLSAAEIQGRNLARQLCEMHPAGNSTNTGILKIRSKNGESTNLHLNITVTVEEDNYRMDYDVGTNSDDRSIERLIIFKSTIGHPTIYYTSQHVPRAIESDIFDARLLRGNETMIAFAVSDFWICDLGLEFFHWPAQKILKKEFHRSFGKHESGSVHERLFARGFVD